METDLHITNRCNLRCRHCVYDSGVTKMPEMTLQTVKTITPSLLSMGVDEVHITGGEPLVHREVYSIIAHLRASKFKVRMQTNGRLLTKACADKLKEAGLNEIMISIDGAKEHHNYFRKSERSFDEAIRATKVALEAGFFVRVNTVLYQDNLDGIETLLALTANIGVSQHSFFYLSPIGRGKELKEKMLSLSQWKDSYSYILTIAKKMNILDKVKLQDVFHGEDIFIEGYDICRKDNCLIMANGDVYSCVFFVGSEYAMGNIHQRNLLAIWEDQSFWDQLKAPRKKRCPNKMCGGGCPGLAYLMTGSIDTCDPRCLPEQNLISSCIRKYVESK
ncbi:MAG: radical SAM protein [Chlamydiota bacterium]